MKKYFLTLTVLALILSACSNSTDKKQEKNTNKDTVSKIEAINMIKIKDFDSLASSLVGKKVLVKGLVDHVCKHGGKKILLADDDAHLRVKNDVRFEDSLVGSEVRVVGVVTEFKLDEDYCSSVDKKNEQALSDGRKTKAEYDDTKEHIQSYRDSMKATGVDFIKIYSLKFVEFK